MILRLRAWDKTTNQMRGCYGFNDMEREVYVCSVADDEFNGQLKTVHALRRSFDEVVVMQSTEIKDKDGVEVYEGDVVEYFCEPAIIKKAKGGFAVVNKKGYDYTTELHGYMKVLGNIYENPELMEVAE